MNVESKCLLKKEALTSYGGYVIEIRAGSTENINTDTPEITEAIYIAEELITTAVMGEVIKNNKIAQLATKTNREQIVGLFKSPIFIEEIPNGYCSMWCCKHLPWFLITTSIGEIKIGWRKSVISIDWTDTLVTKSAVELFPLEDVTKNDHCIHAWSVEKAAIYIEKILTEGQTI